MGNQMIKLEEGEDIQGKMHKKCFVSILFSKHISYILINYYVDINSII